MDTHTLCFYNICVFLVILSLPSNLRSVTTMYTDLSLGNHERITTDNVNKGVRTAARRRSAASYAQVLCCSVCPNRYFDFVLLTAFHQAIHTPYHLVQAVGIGPARLLSTTVLGNRGFGHSGAGPVRLCASVWTPLLISSVCALGCQVRSQCARSGCCGCDIPVREWSHSQLLGTTHRVQPRTTRGSAR